MTGVIGQQNTGDMDQEREGNQKTQKETQKEQFFLLTGI